MTNPDFGFKLRPETIKRIKKSVLSKKKGNLKSLDTILSIDMRDKIYKRK